MTRPVTVLVSVLVALLALAACGPVPEPADPADTGGGDGDTSGPVSLEGSWRLVAGSTADGALEPDPAYPVTLEVSGSTATGRSACNRYSTEVETDGRAVSFGPVGGTEMACAEPVMTLETAYVGALQLVDTAAAEGEQLVLTGPDVELRFDPLAGVADRDLVGTVWELDTLLEGGEGPDATASSVVGEPATLLLAADGTFTASTGCREITGSYVLDHRRVQTSDHVSTDQACPDDVAAQDEQVSAVLLDFGWEVEGDRLTILESDGRGLGYTSERPAE